jgi:hypothetical protein
VDGITDGEAVVMIRNVTKIDAHDDYLELLNRLTSRCREIRMSGAKGSARAKSSDVGCMFPLGTRVQQGESPVGAPVHDTIPTQQMDALRMTSSGVVLLTWQTLGGVASRRCTL